MKSFTPTNTQPLWARFVELSSHDDSDEEYWNDEWDTTKPDGREVVAWLKEHAVLRLLSEPVVGWSEIPGDDLWEVSPVVIDRSGRTLTTVSGYQDSEGEIIFLDLTTDLNDGRWDVQTKPPYWRIIQRWRGLGHLRREAYASS